MREPGIYADIDINEYHASEGISSTGISLILDCPRRYHHEYIVQKNSSGIKEKNDKFKIGRAIHTLVLEPHKFHDIFYVMENEIDLRTKAGKEEYAKCQTECNGREIVRSSEFLEISKISKVISSHVLWEKFENRLVEQSIFWDGGLFNTRFRARPDVYNDQLIVDIKTTDSIKSFCNSIHSYGYHRQAAMQIDGLNYFDGKERTFAFFVIEKKEPYLTSCFVLDNASIAQGRDEYLDASIIYKECLETNNWPGYEEQFQLISLPKWALKTEMGEMI